MFTVKKDQEETDQTLLSIFKLSSRKIQNARARSFNNMAKIRAALVNRTAKETTTTFETSNQSYATKDYYCSGQCSKLPPQPINVQAMEKSNCQPLFYHTSTIEPTTDPGKRQCHSQQTSTTSEVSPATDLNFSLPNNSFETIKKSGNIPNQSRIIVFTSKSPIVACSWQQNLVKLTISPNSSENGETSLQVSEMDTDDRREKFDSVEERLKCARHKLYLNGCTR